MTYTLQIEDQTDSAVEHFQREVPTLEAARAYATGQAKSGSSWTVREGY